MSNGLSKAYDDDDEAWGLIHEFNVNSNTAPTHGRWKSPRDAPKVYAKQCKVDFSTVPQNLTTYGKMILIRDNKQKHWKGRKR